MQYYQPEVHFTEVIGAYNQREYLGVVTLGLTKCTAFPITIACVNCSVLIDTGASHSCTSETLYGQLMLPKDNKYFISL